MLYNLPMGNNIYSNATKLKRKRVKREEPEHKAFVTWFKYTYPGVVILHPANGEARDSDQTVAMLRGKSLKEMGVLPGTYDLFIPQWFLWVEMKPKEGGYLSPAQKIFRDEMERIGYKTFKANGCQEAIDQLQEYLRGKIPCLYLK